MTTFILLSHPKCFQNNVGEVKEMWVNDDTTNPTVILLTYIWNQDNGKLRPC